MKLKNLLNLKDAILDGRYTKNFLKFLSAKIRIDEINDYAMFEEGNETIYEYIVEFDEKTKEYKLINKFIYDQKTK